MLYFVICDFCDFCDFRDFRDFHDFHDFRDFRDLFWAILGNFGISVKLGVSLEFADVPKGFPSRTRPCHLASF